MLLNKYGRLRSVFVLSIVQSVCILSFGLGKAVSSGVLFISISMLSRIAEGFVCSSYLTLLRIMIPSYFDHYSSYLVAYSLGIQLSDLVGPIFGGLLFRHLGYIGIFSAQSGLCFLSSFLLLFFRDHEARNPYRQANQATTISYWSILKIPVRQIYNVRKWYLDAWPRSYLRASTSQSTRSSLSNWPGSSV